MTERENQAALVRSLVGECRMEIREDGFMSRAFVIDGGRLVVKFPRNESVRYDEEIRNLDFVNTLELGVNVQKTAFVGPAGSWLGVYGVQGRPLSRTRLTDEQKTSVGRQLGAALKLLHSADWPGRSRLTLRQELDAWTDRVRSPEVLGFLDTALNERERDTILDFFFRKLPERLLDLGDRPVFSHGDLGDENVFSDGEGRAGIIDFNESCRMDEAADFMDIGDDAVCEEMLTSCGADDVLRQKTRLRRIARPLIVLQPYLCRGDRRALDRQVRILRQTEWT